MSPPIHLAPSLPSPLCIYSAGRGFERSAQELMSLVRGPAEAKNVAMLETAAELVLSGAEIAAGARALPREDRAALELAASRIRRFHERSVPQSWLDGEAGNRLGQLLRPLGRVGIYVPGFQAPLASTTLMLAVPAQVAGKTTCYMQ